MPKISIVVSFFNEASTLASFIQRVDSVFKGRTESYEIIFVNDDSTDGSLAVIKDAAAHKSSKASIRTVTMSRRFGVEECFLAGLEYAKGDAVILMYADLQDPPEVIPQMLEHFYHGSQVVHTVRSKRVGDPLLKKAAAHIAYRMVKGSASFPIPVDAGDFKLLSKKVVGLLLGLSETDPYLRGLIPWIGFKQTCVSYDMQPRQGGNSKVPLFGKKAWTVFLSGVTSFSHFPIPLMLISGLAVFALSGLGCFVLLGQGRLESWSFALAYISLLWAVLVIMLALLGIYVLRTYKDVRGRPRYIVAEVAEI
jgi:dolichol-phosphate mannosyltransferase